MESLHFDTEGDQFEMKMNWMKWTEDAQFNCRSVGLVKKSVTLKWRVSILMENGKNDKKTTFVTKLRVFPSTYLNQINDRTVQEWNCVWGSAAVLVFNLQ